MTVTRMRVEKIEYDSVSGLATVTVRPEVGVFPDFPALPDMVTVTYGPARMFSFNVSVSAVAASTQEAIVRFGTGDTSDTYYLYTWNPTTSTWTQGSQVNPDGTPWTG